MAATRLRIGVAVRIEASRGSATTRCRPPGLTVVAVALKRPPEPRTAATGRAGRARAPGSPTPPNAPPRPPPARSGRGGPPPPPFFPHPPHRAARQLQFDDRVLDALPPPRRIFLETSGNHALHGRQHRRLRHQWRWRPLRNGRFQFGSRTREGTPPTRHLVKDRSVREDVAAPIRRSARHLLRRTIRRRPRIRTHGLKDPRTRARQQDGVRRKAPVDLTAAVRPV